MPTLTRWFIKSGVIYLLLGLFMDLFFSLPRFSYLASAFTLVIIHFLTIGWLTQTIIGVSWWLFPRPSPKIATENRTEILGWLILVFLNSGLLLRAVSEPEQALNPAAVWNILLVFSALFLWLGSVLFVFLIWGRIKER
ncbi:MAG: hypothetical protein M1421_04720 [Candidatus Eremiobacteraeota bacterium]|jgi:hypothetical protein|nr:hypothetical protein [Candidatus Eremiobacteraeota bacterium]MCL5054521.1 hypothetical protein [Bacillota bacterium]